VNEAMAAAPVAHPVTFSSRLWIGFANLSAEAARLMRFAGRTFATMATSLPPAGEFVKQCVEVGLQSLAIVMVVSTSIGLTVALQGYYTFRQLGGESLVSVFAGMTEVRELCPAIAAGVITAKAGTRMAASLGLMRIKEQIDALEVMAVDPYRFLVLPRVWASLIMTPCLILISVATAFAATYGLSTWRLGLDPGAFWHYTVTYIHFADIANGLIKGAVFGALIAIIACYFGFHAAKGPEGVGRATNRAVVITGMVVILVNLVLTNLMYG